MTGLAARLAGLLLPLSLLLPSSAPFEDVARRIRDHYNEQDFEAIQALYDPAMNRALPPPRTRELFGDLMRSHGPWEETEGLVLNDRTATFTARLEGGAVRMRITLDEEDRIAGMWVEPVEPDEVGEVPERNDTRLTLPVRDTWKVVWGGPTPEQNRHHDVPNQRFALDLIGVGEDGRSHRGDGTRNEQYEAYGRRIHAPGPGRVAWVIDGVPDNRPGSPNPYAVLGNAVCIEHGPREYSLLAHFQPRTVRVRPGDEVRRGDLLGLCGNSGNSTEPHLHYHLMTSATIQDAVGIEVHFDRVLVEGEEEERRVEEEYAPVRGDLVSIPPR